MCYEGDTTTLETTHLFQKIERNVDLLFTSPPFALSRQKKYGNLKGKEYVKWFSDLAPVFSSLQTQRILLDRLGYVLE